MNSSNPRRYLYGNNSSVGKYIGFASWSPTVRPKFATPSPKQEDALPPPPHVTFVLAPPSDTAKKWAPGLT